MKNLMNKSIGGPGTLALILAILLFPAALVFGIGDTAGNSGSGFNQGWANSGAPWKGNPVQIGGVGSDGDVYALLTDTAATAITGADGSGQASRLIVVGAAADAAAVAGNPLLIAGQDGTNAQSIKTNTSGELQVGTVASVDVNASLTADADAAVAAATGLRLLGWTARETASTAAAATARVIHGATGATAAPLDYIELLPNETRSEWYGPNGIAAASGLSVDHIAGTVDVTLYYAVIP